MNIKKHYITYKRILLVATVFFSATANLCAQNNPYKIRDDLYRIYTKAYETRRTAKGLQLADSLYHQAQVAKDKKAQCLALTIPFLYHFFRSDRAALEKAGKVLEDKALQTGYIQYYYFVMSNKVTWLLNNDHMSEALDYIKNKQKFAEAHHHDYGIYTGYRSLGYTQYARGDYAQAVESFKKALDFGTTYLPDQDMAQNYRGMSDCYRMLEEYELALNCVEKGLAISKSQQSRAFLQQNKCYALFMLGRDKEFLENYTLAEKWNGLPGGTNLNVIQELRIFKKLAEKNFDSALRDIKKIPLSGNRLRLYTIYYTRQGDFQKALFYYRQSIMSRNVQAAKVTREDLTNMSAKYNNQELEMEKQQAVFQKTRLQLANTQLTLENSSLELNKSKAAEHLAKLNADNYLLSLNNKNLETKQLRNAIAAQKARREAKEKEMAANNKILLILLSVAAVILILIALYLYYSHRMSRKLKTLNQHLRKAVTDLSIAKEKAQQSDRMKTMFIQNMSHEIRTPLNAIVGFTQVLIEMGDALGENEKKEMCQTITDNSELLSTLINDILDMTSLESGKYVMKYEQANVNVLCEQAIKTVTHRCAPGVELRYHGDIDHDMTIETDATRVKQVLINLLTNAEKNTTKGSITLTCNDTEHPGYLTFSVTDTGIGIPKDKIKEIFERFKKLDKYKQGTGLGLNICRMIAEKLGGDIYVDERYKHGARFVFTIKLP